MVTGMETELTRRKMHNAEFREGVDRRRLDSLDDISLKLVTMHESEISSVLVVKQSLHKEKPKILVVADDINKLLFDHRAEELRISAIETAMSLKMHVDVDVILASQFWDGFSSKDPAVLDLVRDSLVLKDNGFFLPLQELLVKGKVRPSRECVNVYFIKAQEAMKASDSHMLRSALDLYWAVVDSAHAAVMVAGLTPPSPKDLAETLRRQLIIRNLLHKRCADIMDSFYSLAKRILHKELFSISGRELDLLFEDADFFIQEVTDFVKEHTKRGGAA